uniref:Uncharacterized protein n=1 Tax=Mustela putorius furo TaxID=9669 RepID=M3XW82_MUSPF
PSSYSLPTANKSEGFQTDSKSTICLCLFNYSLLCRGRSSSWSFCFSGHTTYNIYTIYDIYYTQGKNT